MNAAPQTVAETSATPAISVVSPCFNEEDGVDELLRRVTDVCRDMDIAYEIVLVDDGSTDSTWALIEKAASEQAEVRGVRLSRNFGQQSAVTAGLTAARGDRILMLDADLQDPPELLPEMMGLMDQGYDVVYGRRKKRKGETIFKRASSSAFYRVINRLSDVKIPVDTGDFRLVSRRVVDEFLSMGERTRFVRGMIAWVGHRQIGLEFERDPRFAGETKWPLRAMIRMAADALTGYSIAPLRIATGLAFLSLSVAAAMGIYVFISLIAAQPTSGWASLLLAISFFSGIQLLTLGILGEYVGRLYSEAKGRPLFLVECETRSDEHNEPLVSAVPPSTNRGESGQTIER